MTFGPMFGEPDGKTYLTLGLGMVANSAQFKDDTYPEGVYARQRTDNDYIVLVQYGAQAHGVRGKIQRYPRDHDGIRRHCLERQRRGFFCE